MAFKKNEYEQITLHDSFLFGLTDREKKTLEKSWAKIFADEIFPAIDEELFSVLYSENEATRPNTPVNVIVGALIIKELLDYSDDEMVENLMLDLHLQYALHTTGFREQPLSDKSLSRFRKRCYEYENTHHVDLYRDCVKDLSGSIAKIMGINDRVRRMDSMMIASNIRFLSRMELIYTCLSKLAIHISKSHPDLLEENKGFLPYTDPNDYNKVFYHQRSTSMEDKIEKLLKDSDALLEICGTSFEDALPYQLFVRCLSEQTIVEDGVRRMRKKEDGGLDSTVLQNPSDPDATYRVKTGKTCRGYAANVTESVGKAGSVVTDYRYEPSIYSDSQFLKDSIEETQSGEEESVLVTDGGYSGGDNTELAAEKNIRLITTALTGKDAPDVLADFKFKEDGTEVLECAAGNAPKSCSYTKSTKQCNVSFHVEQCRECPYKNECNPKFKKTVASFITSQNASNRAKAQRFMKSEEFGSYAKIRNGVETVPSNLRKNYHLEKLPRGKQRGKLFFGSKIAALNFRKLFNFRKGQGHYAPNPVLV